MCESERVSRRVCSCARGQCERVCVCAFDASLFEVLVLAAAAASATSTAASMLTNFNPEEQEFIFLLKSKR